MDAQFSELTRRLGESIGTMSAADTQARCPGKWTVQQNMEHLLLTYASTSGVVRERIEKRRPTQARPRFAQHLKRLLVVNVGYFPHGVTAPPVVTPAGGGPELDGMELLRQAAEQLMVLDQLLNRASSLFGHRTRFVSHMILGPLSPVEWRRFHLVHGLHHLRHIEEIRRRALPRPNR